LVDSFPYRRRQRSDRGPVGIERNDGERGLLGVGAHLSNPIFFYRTEGREFALGGGSVMLVTLRSHRIVGGPVMSRLMLCGIVASLVLSSHPTARADDAEDKAVAALEKIDGRVHRDDTKPEKPVVSVTLNGRAKNAGHKELAAFRRILIANERHGR
jgi:hypothetical protein